MQNCEDVVRMGGCAQGGADYCCACSNGIDIKKFFLIHYAYGGKRFF